MKGLSTYLVWIGAVSVGVAFWLFLGWVFGAHAKAMRDAVDRGCVVAGGALGRAGDAVFGWARWCFQRIEQALDQFGQRTPQQPVQQPVHQPAAAVVNPQHALSSTIVALGALVLAALVALNGYLLFEITPDLFSFSPEDVKSGSGKWIAFLVPIGILLGEVVGGLLVKAERRRKAAGAADASVLIAWLIFVFCYVVELAAGVRRAWAFLWVASPFADEATVITVDSAATAALWLALAGGIPWVIFALSMFVEPVITRSNAVGRFVTWLLQAFRTVGVGLLAMLALLLALILFGGSGILTGIGGILLHALGGFIRYVVLAIAVVLIVLCIQASFLVMQKIRELRGTNAAAILPLVALLGGALAQSGCSGEPGDGQSHAQRTYATAQASALQPTPSPESFDKVATVNLTRYIGERHKVVRVMEPKIHVCLADLSESIRSAGLRSAVLRKCAELVSEATAEQGPETLGIVIPIVDAGLSSELPQERFERADVPTRCATNPPLPLLSTRSTVSDKKVQEIRVAYERAERECSESVAAEYGIARQRRDGETVEFRQRVAAAFTATSYPRTDIFGTLTLVRELVRTERVRVGSATIPVRVTIISDLEDDANGCTATRRAVRCPGQVVAAAKELCDDAAARCTIHQVLQATPAGRGRGFEGEKRAREERQLAWREFWTGLSEHIEAFTFTAPAGHRAAPPTASRVGGGGGGDAHDGQHGTACSGAGTIRAKRATLANGRSWSDGEWLAFGRALAACGPETTPWTSVDLASRAEFLNEVALSFYNGDVGRNGLFASREPKLHAKYARAWGLE